MATIWYRSPQRITPCPAAVARHRRRLVAIVAVAVVVVVVVVLLFLYIASVAQRVDVCASQAEKEEGGNCVNRFFHSILIDFGATRGDAYSILSDRRLIFFKRLFGSH